MYIVDRYGQVAISSYIITPQHVHDIDAMFRTLSSCNDILGGLRGCPVEVHICRKDLPTGHSHKNASTPWMIPRCFQDLGDYSIQYHIYHKYHNSVNVSVYDSWFLRCSLVDIISYYLGELDYFAKFQIPNFQSGENLFWGDVT